MLSSLFGEWIQISVIEIVSKLFAVGIVMVYNYVTRKLIYERPFKYSIDIWTNLLYNSPVGLVNGDKKLW